MIFDALKLLSMQLNQYLKGRFGFNEDIAILSPVKDSDRAFPNRVSIAVVGMERETAGGISFQRRNLSGEAAGNSSPSWQVSVNVLLSVIFQEKQYEESLRVFSALVAFVQNNHLVRSPGSGHAFSLEPVNLSIHELSNLWSICGENYYPSIMCKLRLLVVDENEITDLSYLVTQPETGTELKKE